MPKPPAHFWVLIDRSNGDCGHDYGGHSYGWFFPTRERAREHKKAQNADPTKARLSGPHKYILADTNSPTPPPGWRIPE